MTLDLALAIWFICCMSGLALFRGGEGVMTKRNRFKEGLQGAIAGLLLVGMSYLAVMLVGAALDWVRQ